MLVVPIKTGEHVVTELRAAALADVAALALANGLCALPAQHGKRPDVAKWERCPAPPPNNRRV